ncbi:methyl-accepting chemotaxis protein [Silvimonas amylolytica]|uniref:Aerotaxis receptor n=1 Tax=Silvimonas amylolytica TaxID=449663 RepID=A0ABQ2PRP6_9NEIS|nr:PAS domain-containing methyl-accepting chemotaxis protein [Silvimonas amylolytica]GGP28310.1 aerotaxis receptor [Silvimonas amylolytica]
MRQNLPVTQVEHHLDPKRPVVTKTDLKGTIRYANPAFVEISGFTADELIGNPHNIVRHPDMPSEVYADMWQTLKEDRPWRGIVKNRCKNGDFYWVDAYATPLYEHGHKTGYMSVRNKPDQADIARANQLYADIRARRSTCPPTRIKTLLSLRTRLALLAVVPLLLAALPQAGMPVWMALPLALIAALGLGIWCWQGFSAPLGLSRRVLHELSQGNFRFDASLVAASEFTPLLVALKSMQINLRAIIADIVSAAADLTHRTQSAQQEVSSVSERGNSQAEGVASVAAALQQLAVSVKEIESSTTLGAQHAQTTMQLVTEGDASMRTSHTMTQEVVDRVHDAQARIDELNSGIGQIGRVTAEIRGLADQTNLLALNAAIEAARAGEQGRGFAVVADEVRKLAERTATSTVHIASSIERVVQQSQAALAAMQLATRHVEESVSAIEHSSEALAAIKASNTEVAQSSTVISDMVCQQSQASSEMAQHMERISVLTDGNRHSAERATESMRALAGTAEELHALVRHFEGSL